MRLLGIQKQAVVAVFLAATLLAAQAARADHVSAVGHITVSVASTLSIIEVSPVKFGNIIVAHPGRAGDGTLTMDFTGTRTVGGANTDGLAILSGAVGNDGGSQAPGLYSITGANNNSNVYVSFSEAGVPSALIDVNHPGNNVVLTGPNGDTFTADTFTFNSSGTDAYGLYITTTGSTAMVRVGAMLHTSPTAKTYGDGSYRGTFNIMVSY